jgi:hypothetical protein
MTADDEQAGFFWLLGKAIAQWGYVEGQLLRVAVECFHPQDRSAFAVAYHSIDNFRSKLKVADNVVQHAFSSSPHFDKWTKCEDRLRRLAERRNAIAHGWHEFYFHAKSGQRWAIIPLHQKDGQLIHSAGLNPPEGSICIQELAYIHEQFYGMTVQLCNAYELLVGRKAPFPESGERVKSPPTIRTIERRIREAFGRQQRPSGALPGQKEQS